jgi:outer membrane lipoprotein-sorting protein
MIFKCLRQRLPFCIALFFLSVMGQLAYGQSAAKAGANTRDPKAKAILDKIKKQFDGYKTMEARFEIELELPNRPSEVQKGNLVRDGKKYAVKLNDQEIYADGKTVWVYMKKNKEVQIMDMDDDGPAAFISPDQLLSVYDKNELFYEIAEERKVSGNTYVDIDCKPVSKYADYAKMRITIDKTNNKLLSLRVFSKDGTRYTLKLMSITGNKKYDPGIFVFNPKAFPGVHIEDLRMD